VVGSQRDVDARSKETTERSGAENRIRFFFVLPPARKPTTSVPTGRRVKKRGEQFIASWNITGSVIR